MSETKLKFFGILKTANEQGKELDYKAVADELGLTASTLRRWEAKAKETDDVATLIDVDEVILDRVTKAVEEELEELPQTRVNPITGDIELVKPEDTTVQQRKQRVNQFKQGVDGLQALNEETQTVAYDLLGKITEHMLDQEQNLNTKDLANLTQAVTSIQNAFFNKPQTNVQVNTIQGESGSLLQLFKEKMKN